MPRAEPRLRSVVENVLEDLAGLERQHAPRADRDLLAGLRVPPRARVLVTHHEVAEAGDLDLLPALQGFLDGVEHGLDDLRGFFLGKAADLLVDILNDVGLRHSHVVYPKNAFCVNELVAECRSPFNESPPTATRPARSRRNRARRPLRRR